MIVIKPIPEARIAFISLSSDSLPKVIRVASKTAIGTESAKIQARFKNKYSSIVNRSNPLPKNLSKALSKKFTKRMKVIINREKINGSTSSFKKYLYKSIGDNFKTGFPNTDAWLITSNIEASKFIGLRPSKRIKVFNGKLESRLLHFRIYEGSKKVHKLK